jgi:hypothetical protein
VDSVHVGATDPYGVKVTLRSETLDLAQGTAGFIVAKRPDGTVVQWAATLTEHTSKSVVLTHMFAAGELPEAGNYDIEARLTVPTKGDIRSRGRTTLRVVAVL